MRYRCGVFVAIQNWFADNPSARTALPWVSGAALIVGLLLMMGSLKGGGSAASPSPAATATGDLTKGLAAATTYFEDQDPPTFAGFVPRTAEGTDSSLTWNRSEAAVEGQVTIRAAKGNNVLLVSKDQTGTYCLYANSKGEIRKGTGDVAQSADCTGGW
jgi:hypothetical protein